MKIMLAAALLAMPAATFAASHMEKKDAAATEQMAPATASALPKCTAKVQDSCDQSATTEKNALDYYPAEARDAGNNKIAGMRARKPAPMQ